MKEQTPGGMDVSVERLAQARTVYRQIFQALQASLTRLQAGDETAREARERQDLYRTHLKQLQTVFEIEGSLDTFGGTRGATRIDLDEARREIRDRLDRLIKRRGD